MFKEFQINCGFNSFVFLLVYISLPSKYSTLDGYGFAYLIKQGEDLFLPHHLLYNFFGFLWVRLLHLISEVDTLFALKIMNAFAASISLMLLERILRERELGLFKRIVWVVFAGSSWAIMRFATENETYILPLVFSLFGSYFFSLYFSKGKLEFLFWAGFLSAFAALIHQIHFFWWFGLLIGLLLKKESLKKYFTFIFPSFVVPLVYFFSFVYTTNNSVSLSHFINFVFHDYLHGTAEFSINFKNILLTPINFIRTFIQVHGYMYNYIKENLWLIVCLVSSFILFAKFFVNLKTVKFNFKGFYSNFIIGHFLAFLFHLLFAFVSHGNAEFMIMLPFLLTLILSGISKKEIRPLFYLVGGILIWNLSFGAVPLAKYNVDGDKMVADFIIDNDKEQKGNSYFILFNLHRVANMIGYYENSYSIKNPKSIEEFKSREELISEINQSIASGRVVYTDCFERPKTISRASLLINSYQDAFNEFKKEKVDSSFTLSGKYYLYRIKKTENLVLSNKFK